MTTVKMHVFDLEPFPEPRFDYSCPSCGEPLRQFPNLGTVEPDFVKGNHVFEVDVHQCEKCDKIVIIVWDDFDQI